MKYFLVVLALLLAGCGGGSRAATRPATEPVKQVETVPEGPVMVHVDVYQMTVPMGAISRSDEFWKRVDEHAIDVATYDLLLRNSIRVGIAPNDDWPYFKNIIDQNPATTKKMSIEGLDVKSVELEMTKEVEEQTIFFFDGGDNPGRDFGKSKNMMMLSFQRAPRKEDAVRIALCPVVQASRKRLEYTPMNQEVEVQYVAPERLYECNLRAEVPIGKFMIVGPSPDAHLKWSIGNRFLIKEDEAELMETVILMVPRLVKLGQPQETVAR